MRSYEGTVRKGQLEGEPGAALLGAKGLGSSTGTPPGVFTCLTKQDDSKGLLLGFDPVIELSWHP